MKDGYTQMKMSDLDEQLKQMKNVATTLGYQIQGFERKVGGYDVLLGKLHDLELIKNEVSGNLLEKNELLLHSYKDDMFKDMKKIVNGMINNKTKEIESGISRMNRMIDTISEAINIISEFKTGVFVNNCILAEMTTLLLKKNIFTVNETQIITKKIEKMNKRYLKSIEEQ